MKQLEKGLIYYAPVASVFVLVDKLFASVYFVKQADSLELNKNILAVHMSMISTDSAGCTKRIYRLNRSTD